MPIGVLVLRTRNEPLWHLPWSRCHSYIRLRRVLLLRSGIRLSPSDIRYASLGGEYNITATTELQNNSEQYHCCLQQYHADTVSISLPIRYPRLIVNIKFFERQTPRMLDKYPTKYIKYNADTSPECSRNQSLGYCRFNKTVHI